MVSALRSTMVLGAMAEMVSPCRTFDVSETCYRNSPLLSDETEAIADLLVGLTSA
jgi:putative transposase